SDTYLDELGSTVGEGLLKTHQSFLRPLEGLLDSGLIKGLAHITGGSFLENIPRILPENVSVEIKRGTWPELPVFSVMQKLGNVDEEEMFRTFNMGIGSVVFCAETNVQIIHEALQETFIIGTVKDGNKSVLIV